MGNEIIVFKVTNTICKVMYHYVALTYNLLGYVYCFQSKQFLEKLLYLAGILSRCATLNIFVLYVPDMSYQSGKVISLILQERFGELVGSIGNYLYKYGPCSLLYLKKQTELPLSKIKEVLSVLLKYSLISLKRPYSTYLYSLEFKRILWMLRYPAYLKLIKRKFGGEAELLLEEILQKGYVNETDLLTITQERLKKTNEAITLSSLKEKLNSLIIAKYLINFANFNIKEDEVKNENNSENACRKDCFWTFNPDRFHQDLRDDFIVSSFANKFDTNAAELVRILIQQMYVRTEPWAEASNPVPIIEVKEITKKMNTYPQLVTYFDQYVAVLEQDSSRFMNKIGEASGGSFQLCMKKIFTVLAWEVCEHVVLEKFDSKAARIFRLVKNKSYIEPDQIQKLAMIPAKEAKRLSYQLVEENFFQIQELKKTSSSNNTGPNKSFILFNIQLNSLVRTVLEMCYKSLFNIMTRRCYFRYQNKRIIDKKQRIDTILLSMRSQGASEEQLLDIEEMLTPPERELLIKIENALKKINLLEIEIDQTMFILELYLAYQ